MFGSLVCFGFGLLWDMANAPDRFDAVVLPDGVKKYARRDMWSRWRLFFF